MISEYSYSSVSLTTHVNVASDRENTCCEAQDYAIPVTAGGFDRPKKYPVPGNRLTTN